MAPQPQMQRQPDLRATMGGNPEGAASMDPFTATAATSAASGVVKGAGSAVGKQIFALLAKRTQRLRVGWAVTKAAKAEGIKVRWSDLNSWLRDLDVRAAIAFAQPESLHELAARLAFEVQSNGPDANVAAERIIALVRDESLRRMTEGDGRVTQTRRLEHAIHSTAREQRALLTAGGDELAFARALEKLHPWRSNTAHELAGHRPPLRALIITLASERDRRTLLQQWAINPPVALADASADTWCWFACLAADYGAEEAALTFIANGVDAGASASYWWACAGLLVGTGTPAEAARARELWMRSQPKHPIAAAGEAIESGGYATAEQILDKWAPEAPNDQSIKAILCAAAATGRGDFNRAISIGIAAATAHPEGSGNLLRTAEALLSRGHYGQSDHPLDDFARAFDLAIQARDARRNWLGDSVAPILTAVKASALATDFDQAWRLTQATPEGNALAHEAHDDRLRRESAVLAAMMGRFEKAHAIADGLGDAFVSHTVDGWQAFTEDRRDDAEVAWLRAWDCAPDDISRLQTAAALAPIGRQLPDLRSLSSDYHRAIERIQNVHDVMSRDTDMSLLRARAIDSEELTILLAERLVAQGKTIEAAGVLEAGGTRWSDPLMMRMAAARYESAGDYKKAYDVAATALSLGGAPWAGRLETLMIQFDSLESQGQFNQSLAIAREMVSLAPANLTIRWALVHSLVRAGSTLDAWRALTYEGKAVDPRSPSDARTWIALAAECDDSPEFVQRSLQMIATWQHEPDVVGVFLTQIYYALSRHERDLNESDIRELHRATEEFTNKHPENGFFRKLAIDENDAFTSLTDLLRMRAIEDPEISDLRERVGRGELPLGFAAELTNRTYVEVCIRIAAGFVYSHIPSMAPIGQAAAAAAFDSRVVIDASAATTLTLFDREIVDTLIGSFVALETTDSAYRDALDAQRSLNMLSTMTMSWDPKGNRPLITKTDEEDARAYADRADRVVELLARTRRCGWPSLKSFAEFSGDGTWLSALDLALTERRSFWCDDRSLRQLAASEGAQTFGTIDLLTALEVAGLLSPDLGDALRARLVVGYHVDLDFDPDVLTLAAQLDAWMPKGAAAALTRVAAWRDPVACVRFASTAMARVATTSPTGLANWTAAVTLGLVRITDGSAQGASENLNILLTHQLTQPWLGPDTLPFVIEGIRATIEGLPGIVDPLSTVFARTYAQMAEKHGAAQAAEFLLMLATNLCEEDKALAARAILTSKLLA